MKKPLVQQTDNNKYTQPQNVLYFIVLILLLLSMSFSAVIAQSNHRKQITQHTPTKAYEKTTLVLETHKIESLQK